MRSRKRKKAADKECSPKPAAQNIVQQERQNTITNLTGQGQI